MSLSEVIDMVYNLSGKLHSTNVMVDSFSRWYHLVTNGCDRGAPVRLDSEQRLVRILTLRTLSTDWAENLTVTRHLISQACSCVTYCDYLLEIVPS